MGSSKGILAAVTTGRRQASCLLLTTFLATVTALSLPTSGRSKASSAPVNVFDNVLPDEEQRAALHEYASKSGLEHKCFTRPLVDSSGSNIIELTLDAILSEIDKSNGDDNNPKQYVEYWTRQEWRHIEAHADVDENLSKKMDQSALDLETDDLQTKFASTYQKSYGHRYPTHGHVLYLQVGSEVRGPTVVFQDRSSGGDLLRQLQEADGECSDEIDRDANGVKLSIVPAVPGRLLRFDGRDLHAVPRPTDIWMLPFVKGGAEYEPEEVWGRSVILFNVWPADEAPPLEVPLDKRNEKYSPMSQTAFCNSFDGWNEVKALQKAPSSLDSAGSQLNQSVKVWLLGNDRRRDHPLRTVSLRAPEEGGREVVKESLMQDSQVTELWLQQQ